MKLYTVQKGDTMWKIAKRYGIATQALIDVNPQISDPNVLQIGDQLYLPVDLGDLSFAGDGFSGYEMPQPTWPYVVKKGDTLWKISQQVGIPLQSIITANPQIVNPNQIFPGQVVQILGQTPAPFQMGPYGQQTPVAPPIPPTPPHLAQSAPMKPATGGTPPVGFGLNASFDAEYFKQTMPHKAIPKPPKMKVAPPSVAKLYVEEVDQVIEEKVVYPPKAHGEMIICEDPYLPSNMIITGKGPEIPVPQESSMMSPFTAQGAMKEIQIKKETKLRESSSLWEMESSWFRDSGSR